jgi:hypothetical protein
MTIGVLIHILIVVLVLGIIYWLASWALAAVPLREPFGRIAHIVLVLIFVLILLSQLLPLITDV